MLVFENVSCAFLPSGLFFHLHHNRSSTHSTKFDRQMALGFVDILEIMKITNYHDFGWIGNKTLSKSLDKLLKLKLIK